MHQRFCFFEAYGCRIVRAKFVMYGLKFNQSADGPMKQYHFISNLMFYQIYQNSGYIYLNFRK